MDQHNLSPNALSPPSTVNESHPLTPRDVMNPPLKRARYEMTSPQNAPSFHSGVGGFAQEYQLTQGVTHNFVGNEFIVSGAARWTRVLDPATQADVTRVPESTSEEVKACVAVAAEAQPGWAAMAPHQRLPLMLNFVQHLRQQSSRIRNVLVNEVGKTLQDAGAEFERGLDAVQTALAVSLEMNGQHHTMSGCSIVTINEPLGICLSISPFNFPFMIPLWSIPYALLTGNVCILKPSEKTPTAALIMAECFLKAGFPPGVVNVINGGRSVVEALMAQPMIRAVSFVGSEAVGERLYDHARATKKRIQAECSGKNHGVVLPDADRRSTVFAIAASAFGAAGQRCMALSVAVLVGETRSWLPDLVKVSNRFVLGCGHDPSVNVGPLVDRVAKARVEGIIADAVSRGATVVLDGRDVVVPEYPNGNFIGPTILTDVETDMACYQEEIFGPVLVCMFVETMEEAIELVNNNRYGNGCTLFTSSPNQAQAFQKSVNVGQIGINVPIIAPSGPVQRTSNKDSFMGDLNVHGRSHWQFYTQTKTVTARWHS